MIRINDRVEIADSEIEITAILAGGPGGQHVNKTSTAIQLRFNIPNSSLEDYLKQRLLRSHDHRISTKGELVLKVTESRSQHLNKEIAIEKLAKIINAATITPKRRVKTKLSKNKKAKRAENKKAHSQKKKQNLLIDILLPSQITPQYSYL